MYVAMTAHHNTTITYVCSNDSTAQHKNYICMYLVLTAQPIFEWGVAKIIFEQVHSYTTHT
jgi:hypothetical protein